MSYAFKRVLNGMREVIKRIDAPFVSLSVVMTVQYSVNDGVSHVQIRRGHINFGSQASFPVRKFAVFHPLEQIEIFLDASVPVRAFFSRFGQRAAVFFVPLVR